MIRKNSINLIFCKYVLFIIIYGKFNSGEIARVASEQGFDAKEEGLRYHWIKKISKILSIRNSNKK